MSPSPPPRRSVTAPELPQAVVPLAVVAVLAAILWRIPTEYVFGAYAFAGAALVLAFRARPGEILSAALVGAAIAIILQLLHSSPSGSWVATIATGLGSGAVVTAAFTAARARANAREAATRRLVAVFTMPAFVAFATIVLAWSASWHALTFDAVLASLDRSFGIDPSALAGTTALRSPFLWWTCKVVYDSLPLALCAVAAARHRRFGANDKDHILLATVVAGAAAQVVSQLVPACGPRYLWGAAFPLSLAGVARGFDLVRIAPTEFRNAFPSLHMTGAFFVAWSAHPFGRLIRVLTWLYVALTVIATLGSGEHYLVDLVVAAPFALAIRLAVRREETLRIVGLLALVAVWTFLIRERALLLIQVPGLTIGLALICFLAAVLPFESARERLAFPSIPVFDHAAIDDAQG